VHFFLKCVLLVFMHFICIAGSYAQLLPDNKTLNPQSLARWMQSNRAMAELVRPLEDMASTPEEVAAFEYLSPAEQDKKIAEFLQMRKALIKSQEVCMDYGWQSVGEYKRLGERLGNAIAAYFLLNDLSELPDEAAAALRERADPAILAVSESDVAFIKANEKLLREYIQAYGLGR
jgi:hypothetical protein